MADPTKKVPDLNCEVQDLLLDVVDLIQEVPDLRSGGTPPQFNPDDTYMSYGKWENRERAYSEEGN